jgi:hypothetical protein
VDENTVGASDDVNIQGFNLSSQFDALSSEAEAYYVNKRDKATAPAGSSVQEGSVNTIGIRGSSKPTEGGVLYGELAYQFGRRTVDPTGVLPTGDAQQAWAVDLGGEYTFANVATTPMLGTEWRFYSGKQITVGSSGGAEVTVGGWAPVSPGYFRTALREFQTQSTAAGFYANDQSGVTSSATNQHELAVYGSLQPLEDVIVSPRISWFIADESILPAGQAKAKRNLGTEWDTSVVYNYTDDVQLGLIYALFKPGSVFRDPNDDTAQELISTVSVKF